MKGGLAISAFAGQGSLAPALAAAVADDLQRAIDTRGGAVLAVSGGTTPVPLFRVLRRAALDWSRVTVMLVDERWVDPDHADSNAALVLRHLLQDSAARAQFQPMKNAATTAAEGCAEAVDVMSRLCPVDVAILGMGADGHTASWFPGAQGLAQALDPGHPGCCVALQPPGRGHERLSLSLSAIREAGRRYLHFTGSDKWSTLERALLPGEVAELPVRALLRDPQVPLQVCYAVQDTAPEETA